MLDHDATIRPGGGLGGIEIGTPVAAILATARPVRVVELPPDAADGDAVTIHSFGAIRTWSVRGIVEQVGAFEGYTGRTPEGIGIGSTVADLLAAYGEIAPLGAEGMLRCPAAPGLGVEVEGAGCDDPAARALQIFVHAVDDES